MTVVFWQICTLIDKVRWHRCIAFMRKSNAMVFFRRYEPRFSLPCRLRDVHALRTIWSLLTLGYKHTAPVRHLSLASLHIGQVYRISRRPPRVTPLRLLRSVAKFYCRSCEPTGLFGLSLAYLQTALHRRPRQLQ